MKQIRTGGKTSADLPDNVAGGNGEEEIVGKIMFAVPFITPWAQRMIWLTSRRRWLD